MPAVVYCVANNDALTPIKGPNMVDASTHHIALRSLTACRNCASPFLLNNTKARKKPTSPMYARMTY